MYLQIHSCRLYFHFLGTLIETKIKTSKEGYAEFILKQDKFKNDTYKFVIEASGLKKSFNTKKLW